MLVKRPLPSASSTMVPTGFCAEVKIPKLVTGRDGRDEQVLRAPSGAVAAEAGIGRSENVGLAGRTDDMRALIGTIVRRAAAGVSGPLHDGPIDMNLIVHQPFR